MVVTYAQFSDFFGHSPTGLDAWLTHGLARLVSIDTGSKTPTLPRPFYHSLTFFSLIALIDFSLRGICKIN